MNNKNRWEGKDPEKPLAADVALAAAKILPFVPMKNTSRSIEPQMQQRVAALRQPSKLPRQCDQIESTTSFFPGVFLTKRGSTYNINQIKLWLNFYHQDILEQSDLNMYQMIN